MGKKGTRPTRRERREEHKREKLEAAETRRSSVGFRQRLLVLIAIASGGGAFAVHQLDGPQVAVGLVLLAGVGIFLAVALGGLGGGVPPRDRTKGSNIDFGA